jgi:hypothetical protein
MVFFEEEDVELLLATSTKLRRSLKEKQQKKNKAVAREPGSRLVLWLKIIGFASIAGAMEVEGRLGSTVDPNNYDNCT